MNDSLKDSLYLEVFGKLLATIGNKFPIDETMARTIGPSARLAANIVESLEKLFSLSYPENYISGYLRGNNRSIRVEPCEIEGTLYDDDSVRKYAFGVGFFLEKDNSRKVKEVFVSADTLAEENFMRLMVSRGLFETDEGGFFNLKDPDLLNVIADSWEKLCPETVVEAVEYHMAKWGDLLT